MFKLATLTSTLLLLAAPFAQAQTQALKCGPRAELVETLGSKYKEQLIGCGLAGTTRILEVWRATDGSSWTILLTEAAGQSCILASGADWVDFPEMMATMMGEFDS